MSVIKNKYEIDANEAIATLNKLQSSFVGYNNAIGQVAAQYATFNSAGKGATVTFSQINEEGRKVTTTVREVAGSYETMSVKVGVASNAQRKLASDMQKQRELADSLARQVAGPGASATPTTFPGVVNPALIGQSTTAIASLTRAQVDAAIASNGLSGRSEAAFRSIVAGADRAKQGLVVLQTSAANLKAKFGEFGQIAFATGIYRGLSLLQLGLTQGARTASEYSRQIGLITTLSKGTADTFESWDHAIRKVADDLGRPVTEVATATYDALSNQVIKTSQDMELLSKSFELARVTGASGTNSINVLSSIINTYGEKAGNASQISDQLFTTVDLGRVRIDELNGVIGRSASIAQTAGVSFKELQAGLIVLTQTGLDSAEAATLLNNVYSQLIKPNEALAAQIKLMGFSSGQAAVQTLGFAGVMSELQKASVGASDGIAKFFPEIRGLRGAASFAGEGITKFNQALVALDNASGNVAEANKKLEKSFGFQLSDEVNKIKNFFTVDLGQKAIESVAHITQSLGGMKNITENLTRILLGVGTAAASVFVVTKVITFGEAIFSVIGYVNTLNTSIAGTRAALVLFGTTATVTTGALAATVATVAGVAIAIGGALGYAKGQLDNLEHGRAARLAASFADEAKKHKALVEKEAEDRINAFSKSIDATTRIFGIYIAKARQLNNTLLEDSKKNATEISEALGNTGDVFLGLLKKNVNNAEQKQSDAVDIIKQIDKDAIEYKDKAESDAVARQIQRIKDAAAQGAKFLKQGVKGHKGDYFDLGDGGIGAIANIVTQRNKQLSQKIKLAFDTSDLEHAKQFLDEMLSNFEHLKKYNFIGVDAAENSAVADFGAQEQKLKQTLIEQTAERDKQVVQAKLQLKTLEDTIKKAAEFSTKGIFNKKDGSLLPKFADDPSKALGELDAIQKKAFALAESIKGIGDPIGLRQYQIALKEISATFAEQRTNLQSLIAQAARDANLAKFDSARKATAEAEKQLHKDITEELKKENIAISDGLALLKQYTAEFARVAKDKQTGLFTGSEDEYFARNIGKHLGNIGVLNNDPAANAELITGELTKIEGLVKRIPSLKLIDPLDNSEIVNATDALDKMRTATLAIKQSTQNSNVLDKVSQDAENRITATERAARAYIAAVDPSLTALLDVERNVETLTGPVSQVTKDIAALNAQLNALENIANKVKNIQIITPNFLKPRDNSGDTGGEVEHNASGGVAGSKGGFLMDFFSGKYAKGTDTIPAMLSRGEFVVNARNTAKYYSQLVAMNAGHAPIYRAQGGPVTNTRVGDINITIDGGTSGNAAGMAKEIASHIRRGVRQGTIRLN